MLSCTLKDWSDDSTGLCWYLDILLVDTKGALLQRHTHTHIHTHTDRLREGFTLLYGTRGHDSKSLYCYLGTLLTGDTEAVLA